MPTQCPDPNNPRINMLIQSIGAVIPTKQTAWFWLNCEFGVEKWVQISRK